MNSWSSKNLGDAMLADECLDRIKGIFNTEHARAGYPMDMAVFFRHESYGRLHCDVLVYFSPASIMVADIVGAQECQPPSTHDLGLLAGTTESWQMLKKRSPVVKNRLVIETAS